MVVLVLDGKHSALIWSFKRGHGRSRIQSLWNCCVKFVKVNRYGRVNVANVCIPSIHVDAGCNSLTIEVCTKNHLKSITALTKMIWIPLSASIHAVNIAQSFRFLMDLEGTCWISSVVDFNRTAKSNLPIYKWPLHEERIPCPLSTPRDISQLPLEKRISTKKALILYTISMSGSWIWRSGSWIWRSYEDTTWSPSTTYIVVTWLRWDMFWDGFL